MSLEEPTITDVTADGPIDLRWESAQRSRRPTFEGKKMETKKNGNKQPVACLFCRMLFFFYFPVPPEPTIAICPGLFIINYISNHFIQTLLTLLRLIMCLFIISTCLCSISTVPWMQSVQGVLRVSSWVREVSTHGDFHLASLHNALPRGSFHSTAARESLWMSGASSSCSCCCGNNKLSSLCCFLPRSQERHLSSPPVKTENKLSSTITPCVLLLVFYFLPLQTQRTSYIQGVRGSLKSLKKS